MQVLGHVIVLGQQLIQTWSNFYFPQTGKLHLVKLIIYKDDGCLNYGLNYNLVDCWVACMHAGMHAMGKVVSERAILHCEAVILSPKHSS